MHETNTLIPETIPTTRNIVGKKLGVGAVASCGPERKRPPSEEMTAAIRQAVCNQLTNVRNLEFNNEPSDALDRKSVVLAAYLAQKEKLNGADAEDMSTSQFTSEQIAQLVLFSPMAQDADKSGDKQQLSIFNAMLANCVTCLSPTVSDKFPQLLKHEIMLFNQRFLGCEETIASTLDGRIKGMQAEVAVMRALRQSDEIETIIPDTNDDLKGKDISFLKDGVTVHIDVKRKGSFNRRIVEMLNDGYLTLNQAQYAEVNRYVFTQYDEKGDSQYIFDGDSPGEIGGFDYWRDGQAHVQRVVENMLEESRQAIANR